jgi:uncharacterized membrane protein
MNKKMNTLLFILGATLFNIFVTIAAFLLLLALYAKILLNSLPESARAWSIPLIFIAAIIVSFVIYRFTLNLLLKKIDMERYFDPIFTGRRK